MESFSYTFAQLADCVDKFTEQLDLTRYSLYLQDYDRDERCKGTYGD